MDLNGERRIVNGSSHGCHSHAETERAEEEHFIERSRWFVRLIPDDAGPVWILLVLAPYHTATVCQIARETIERKK